MTSAPDTTKLVVGKLYKTTVEIDFYEESWGIEGGKATHVVVLSDAVLMFIEQTEIANKKGTSLCFLLGEKLIYTETLIPNEVFLLEKFEGPL